MMIQGLVYMEASYPVNRIIGRKKDIGIDEISVFPTYRLYGTGG